MLIHTTKLEVLYRKGYLELSIESLQNLFLNPNCAEANNNLGVVLKDLGEIEEAIGIQQSNGIKSEL